MKKTNAGLTLRTETVGCNLCGASPKKRLYAERYSLGASSVTLAINRCEKCSLVYVSPRLTPDSALLVYNHDTTRTISHNYCWDGSGDASRFAPLLRRLAELAPSGRFLDVGCGTGQLLKEAQRTGRWDITGVEPVRFAARQAARDTGTAVYASTVEQAPLAIRSFDVVAMLGVLEHLHDPAGTLAHVRSLLKPHGVLAVYVPNFHYLRLKDTGLVALLRKRRWSVLHPQEHQFQYTPRTLRALIQSQGFSIHRLDVGRPFEDGDHVSRRLKRIAFTGLIALHHWTGIHLGGIEAVAVKGSAGSRD